MAPVLYTHTYIYTKVALEHVYMCIYRKSKVASQLLRLNYCHSGFLYLDKTSGSCALTQGKSEAQTLTLSQRLRSQEPLPCPCSL